MATLGYNVGVEQAPITVIEFSDFGCSYCRKFHLESFETLKAEFMDAGKVEWKYIPYVLGIFPNAVEAAVAGECVGEQGHFWEMLDVLFSNQPEWKNSGDPLPHFERYVTEAGFDVRRYLTCQSEGWRRDRVRQGSRAGRLLGVSGTPTFIIDGYPVSGAIPAEMFSDFLNSVLAEKEKAGN